MNIGSDSAICFGQRPHARHLYLKVGVVMLLLAIAGFSTLAKNSQYSSDYKPAHFINISSKMIVSPLPVGIDQTPLRPVARFIPPQPKMEIAREAQDDVPAVPSIGITVSLQHRSPPVFLS